MISHVDCLISAIDIDKSETCAMTHNQLDITVYTFSVYNFFHWSGKLTDKVITPAKAFGDERMYSQ